MRPFFALLSFASVPMLAEGPRDLFDGFRTNWREQWKEERLARNPTIYSAVEVDGRGVLHAISHSPNAGLSRRFEVEKPTDAIVRWRWKVPRSLPSRRDEQTRAGDDYAARVFVVFETSVIPLRTRAINYVWASREPVGSRFVSPYTSNVGICVLRTGDAEAGRWADETRDVLADYRHFFGESPKRISAVAVLVDTDNTASEGEAWFSDLVFATTPKPKP